MGILWVKNLSYGPIAGRIGIILLFTGVFVALVSKFRDINRLSSSTVTYVWVGLIVVGAILSVVFVIDFALKKRKQ